MNNVNITGRVAKDPETRGSVTTLIVATDRVKLKDGKTYVDHLNPDSRRTVTGYVEPAAAAATPEEGFQFERVGYFVADRYDHTSDAPVFNRSVTLRDTWAPTKGKGS